MVRECLDIMMDESMAQRDIHAAPPEKKRVETKKVTYPVGGHFITVNESNIDS